MVQEQKLPPSEPNKPAEDTATKSPHTAPTSTSEVDPLGTDEVKVSAPIDSAVKTQETKEAETVENVSVSPVEIDPLSTDRDDASNNSLTKELSSTAVEKMENQVPISTIKDQNENSGSSAQEKNTIETVPGTVSTPQLTASKLNEPVRHFSFFYLSIVIVHYVTKIWDIN